MKVTFLGTGTSQGVPVIACHCEVCSSLDFRNKRLRSSIHIAVNGKSLIIDTGPDFRQQVLRQRIESLDAVLYTHAHKDHTAGMDDIRGFNFKQGGKEMPIYGQPQVIQQLKKEFSYVFASEKYPGVPQIAAHEITNHPFELQGIEITPIEVMHYKLPVFGYRIGDFTYITDANYIAPAEIEKIKGTKVLVLNALQQKEHISHFTLGEAISMVAHIEPERAYFTHISHRMGLHNVVDAQLPSSVSLAYDGLQISV